MTDAGIAEPDVIERQKVSYPKRWNVVFHNDNTTSMEFVVQVLMQIFRKNLQEAEAVMLKVHNEDKAVVGNYVKDVAETKQNESLTLAKDHGFKDFKVSIEEDE